MITPIVLLPYPTHQSNNLPSDKYNITLDILPPSLPTPNNSPIPNSTYPRQYDCQVQLPDSAGNPERYVSLFPIGVFIKF